MQGVVPAFVALASVSFNVSGAVAAATSGVRTKHDAASCASARHAHKCHALSRGKPTRPTKPPKTQRPAPTVTADPTQTAAPTGPGTTTAAPSVTVTPSRHAPPRRRPRPHPPRR